MAMLLGLVGEDPASLQAANSGLDCHGKQQQAPALSIAKHCEASPVPSSGMNDQVVAFGLGSAKIYDETFGGTNG